MQKLLLSDYTAAASRNYLVAIASKLRADCKNSELVLVLENVLGRIHV